MEKKEKSSRFKWLIIITVVVLVILVICGACFAVTLFSSGDFSNSVSTEAAFDRRGQADETIAVINIDGIIMDSAEATYEENIVDYTLNSLEQAKNDDHVKAVVLVLNTPGGSTYDTAKIGDKIDEVKAEGKLVVTLMEQTAASGGYWIAAKTDYIITGSETITGSIGALWDIVLYDDLLQKIGVEQLRIHNVQSPNKTIGDEETSNPESEKYQILQDLANNSYEQFVDVVLNGRNKTREELGDYLDGRIIDGRQAVESGMADQIGYFEDSIEYISNKLSLNDPSVKMYERKRLSPFDSLFVKLNMLTGTSAESQMRMRMLYVPSIFGSGS